MKKKTGKNVRKHKNTVARTGVSTIQHEKQESRQTVKRNKSVFSGFALKYSYLWLPLILIVTIIAYLPAFNNGFVNWDDDWYVIENQQLRSISSGNISSVFSGFYKGQYSPVTTTLLAFVYYIVQLKPAMYHYVSIIIHLLNVALVYWFLSLLFKIKSKYSKTGKNKILQIRIAVICSVLFAVHVLQVESVAWISAQKVVLYSFFFFASLINYLYYVRNRKLLLFVLSVFLFILSFGSKEQALVLPVTLIVIDFFLNRKLLSRKVIIEKIPFLLLSLIFGIVSLYSQENYGAISDKAWYSFFDRIVYASYAYFMYFVKLIVPYKLAAFYPYPVTINEAIPAMYYLFVVLSLGIVAVTIYSLKYSKYIFFAILFFTINVALSLQVVSTGREVIMADRYIYIPCIGFFLLIALGYNYLMNKKSAIRYIWPVILLALMLFLTGYTYQRAKIWNNGIALWTDVQQKYPTAHVAFYNRGNALAAQGKHNEAIADFNKAQPIKPYHVGTYSNRGIAFANIGEIENALHDFNKVVELDSTYTNVYSNRGNAKTLLGDLHGALADYNKAIIQRPDYIDAYYNRGIVKDSIGDYEGAIADFSKVIEIKPLFLDSYMNRGFIKMRMGNTSGAREDFDFVNLHNPSMAEDSYQTGIQFMQVRKYYDAIIWLDKAIYLKPDYSDAYVKRGLTKENRNDLQGAINDFTKAIQLTPNNEVIYINRGVVNGKSGNFNAAISDFNKAIELNPEAANAYSNRGLAKYNIGNTRGALDDYTKAITLDATFISPYINRAIILKRLKQYNSAMADYDKIIKLKPEHAEAYYFRGILKILTGNKDAGCSDLNKAKQLGNKYADRELQKNCM